MRIKILESDIQRTILAYCAVSRIFVKRRNVAGAQQLNGGRWVRLGTKGMSDLWGILKDGRHFECEVKAPGKKPTDDQLRWLDEVRAAGALAFWADSLDGFIEHVGKVL